MSKYIRINDFKLVTGKIVEGVRDDVEKDFVWEHARLKEFDVLIANF